VVFSNKRRFVAGASCPQCKKQDVVVVFHENGVDWQACVACGHKENLIHQEDKGNSRDDIIPLQNLDSP
jgi:uncharacterized protein